MRVIASAILAIGMIVGAWFITDGLRDIRTGDRYVTVKGMAERDVEADLAIWPLRYVAASDQLEQAQKDIQRSREAVERFLGKYGVAADQIELQRLDVTDTTTNPYQSQPSPKRFIISHTLLVRSESPDQVRQASQAISELIDLGVVLSSDYGPSGPTYLFKGLNDIKPALIAEATAAARASAEQFAKDANATLGGLRRANQGVIQILPRDQGAGMSEESQASKTVRVVSTLEYYLD